MLLTEDEAKTKECRHGGMTPVAFDTSVGLAAMGAPSMIGGIRFGPIQWPTCAASGCMHWRWGSDKVEIATARKPDGDGWTIMPATGDGTDRWRRTVATRGYCGLAGRP